MAPLFISQPIDLKGPRMRHSERRGEGNFWQSAEQIALCPFYGLFLFFGPFSSGQVNYHLGTDKGLGRRRRRRLCLDPISQDPHSSLNCCYLGYVRPVQPSPFPLGSSPTVIPRVMIIMIINEAGQIWEDSMEEVQGLMITRSVRCLISCSSARIINDRLSIPGNHQVQVLYVLSQFNNL